MNKLILLLLGVLCGCTTVGKDVAGNLTSIPSGKGVVVFSTSCDERSLSFPTKVILVEGESQKKYDKVVIFIDAKLMPAPTFADRNAIVRSLTLKPGTYYLIPLPGNPALRVVSTPVYKFSVAPGVVQYIGSISLSGQRLTVETGHFNRDVDYFFNKNAMLSRDGLVSRIITVDRYIAPDNGIGFEIKGIIWEAPE